MTTPELFTFTPTGGRVESSSFSVPFKVLATALIGPAVVWGWQLWSSGTIALSLASSGWLFAALCLMLYTGWYIFNGKTTLDNITLEQTWMWHKRAELRQLAYVKLIRMRGFEWLVAPRLYTKTYSGKLAIFYAASPAMLVEFERMENELKTLRNRR